MPGEPLYPSCMGMDDLVTGLADSGPTIEKT
jgi:hypothetical protein